MIRNIYSLFGSPGHESVAVERGIIGDVDLGFNLAQLIDKYKGLLVGEKVYKKFGNTFPLLVPASENVLYIFDNATFLTATM